MITEVSAELVTVKESVMKETLTKTKKLVEASQLAIMEEVKGASMQEMMEHIEQHKLIVEKDLQQSVLVLQQGIAKSKEEEKKKADMLNSRVDELTKKLES